MFRLLIFGYYMYRIDRLKCLLNKCIKIKLSLLYEHLFKLGTGLGVLGSKYCTAILKGQDRGFKGSYLSCYLNYLFLSIPIQGRKTGVSFTAASVVSIAFIVWEAT